MFPVSSFTSKIFPILYRFVFVKGHWQRKLNKAVIKELTFQVLEVLLFFCLNLIASRKTLINREDPPYWPPS